MFSAKPMKRKQLAATFQYLGTAQSKHRDGFQYRIMYELAVCSDGMTEAQPAPRSFRQNRAASEYII